jgi:hypothetical protein
LSEEEQQRLAEALEQSEDLRRSRKQLEMLRGDISGIPPAESKPFLAERVLRKIALSENRVNLQERFWESLFYTARRVAVATAISLVILLTYYMTSQGIVFADNEVEIEDILETDTFIAME